MPIEFTKVETSTRQAFYDTLLTSWDQHWEKEFQQEFLDWRYGRRTDGETLVAMSGSTCIEAHDFTLPTTARRAAGACAKCASTNGSVTKYLPREIALRPNSVWTQHREVDGEVEDLAPEHWPGED